jgi:hypothetical protein
MIRRILLLFAGIALAVMLPLSASSQDIATRSNEIGRPAEKDEEVTIGRYVFAGIGIDAYEAEELWKPLDNAVNDVDRMRETLSQEFDFESPDEWVLLNEQATANQIRQLIDDLGRNLQPDDNLVFFYAGHGAERPTIFDGEVVSRTGYLVPVGVKESLEESPSQYLEIERLLADLAALPSRHVLVILDSCYSGMALEGEFKTRGGEQTQQAQDLLGRRSRRVLTSAQADQLAADGGENFPDNSLFTGWLTEGLRRAARGTEAGESTPDSNDDGMVTVTELFAFVSGFVGAASDSRQTPDFGAFKFDNRGELVLTREVEPFEAAYNAAVAAYNDGKFDAFFTSVDEALAVQPEGPRPAHLRFLRAEIDDELLAALMALRQLSNFAEAGESVPMSTGELMVAMRKAERQCQKSECEAAGAN